MVFIFIFNLMVIFISFWAISLLTNTVITIIIITIITTITIAISIYSAEIFEN